MTSKQTNRRADVLAQSRDLLRKRGFNAFSHRELANLIGVKSSSVHYYFPTKEDIGLALISEYREDVMGFLKTLDPLPQEQRIERFIDMFVQAASNTEEWCLAGMLASDFMTLGDHLQSEVRRFFEAIEQWLAAQVSLLHPDWAPHAAHSLAKTGIAMLEGALLLARSQRDPLRVKYTGQAFKTLLSLD